ncbi:HNH endonuclease signature motif containing protein [Actinomyces polynesiensis]|uniref:HNH endonuclease signature motif containing protein n=1 Tax=Actinomyces polynesiensis TaxID=1325934 RepID=UPI0005B9AFD1|nr:HNH endonuclease signature motif containing protein [Actinomyces polynesiensis]
MDTTTGDRTPRGEDLLATLGRLLAVARGGCDAGSADEGGTGLSEAVAHLPDDDLLAFIRDAEELGRLVDAARALGAGEVAHRSRRSLGGDGLAARRGCRTPSELVERVTLVSGRTARARVKDAEPLRSEVSLSGERLPGSFPLVRRAVEEGALGLDSARAITTALGGALAHGAGVGEVWQAERELVATATTGHGTDGGDPEESGLGGPTVPEESGCPGAHGGVRGVPADDVAAMSGVWALYLDPDGRVPDEREAMRRRGLTLGRVRGGTVPLKGELLPEVAAQLERLLDAYLNPRREPSVHGASGVPGSPASVDRPAGDASAGDPAAAVPPAGEPEGECGPGARRWAQRRHDALAGILTTAAGCAVTPRLGGAPPTLLVSTTPDQVGDPDGVAFVEGVHDPGRVAVGATVARQIACTGAVQRVVVDATGRVLGLGAPHRLFTAHQRRAIILRDGECVIPGCHVPSTWCEVHHVVEHHEGGATHTDNGVLLCWFHHRTLGTSGWQIQVRSGVPWVRAPSWIDPERTWMPSGGSPLGRWQNHRGRAGDPAGWGDRRAGDRPGGVRDRTGDRRTGDPPVAGAADEPP